MRVMLVVRLDAPPCAQWAGGQWHKMAENCAGTDASMGARAAEQQAPAR